MISTIQTVDATMLRTMINAPCFEFALLGRMATTIPSMNPIRGSAAAVM